jgi:hypothetical protein
MADQIYPSNGTEIALRVPEDESAIGTRTFRPEIQDQRNTGENYIVKSFKVTLFTN